MTGTPKKPKSVVDLPVAARLAAPVPVPKPEPKQPQEHRYWNFDRAAGGTLPPFKLSLASDRLVEANWTVQKLDGV